MKEALKSPVNNNENKHKSEVDYVYQEILKHFEKTFSPRYEREIRKKYFVLTFVHESLLNCVKAALSKIRYGKKACFVQALNYNPRWYHDPLDLAQELVVCCIEALKRYDTQKLGNIEELASLDNLENTTKKFIRFLEGSFKSVLITNNQGAQEVIRKIEHSDGTLEVMTEREYHSKKRNLERNPKVTSERAYLTFSEVKKCYYSGNGNSNKELSETEIVENLADKTCDFFSSGYGYITDPELYLMLKEEIEKER